MPLPASALRILICEREYLLAIDLAAQLEAAGAKVVQCVSDYSKVSEPLALRCNVAVVDVEPELPGFDRTIQLLEAAGLPIVLTTAYRRRELPKAYWHLPCQTKPTDIVGLIDLLAKVALER